jgi:hypothetical protein
VTESPWAAKAPPSPVAASPSANWGFYLLVNVGLSLAVGIVAALASAAGIELPGPAMNLFVLFLSVMIAGGRWLKANGLSWTRRDRGRLALAYTAVNLVLTVVAGAATFYLIKAGLGADLGLPSDATTLSANALGIILVAAVLIAVAISYALTRLVLGVIVNSQAKATGPDGKLL